MVNALKKYFSYILEENKINFALIPANCTDKLQPLDLSFNKLAKMFLHGKF